MESEQIHYSDMKITFDNDKYMLLYYDTDINKIFRYLFDKLEDAYKYKEYIMDLLTY